MSERKLIEELEELYAARRLSAEKVTRIEDRLKDALLARAAETSPPPASPASWTRAVAAGAATAGLLGVAAVQGLVPGVKVVFPGAPAPAKKVLKKSASWLSTPAPRKEVGPPVAAYPAARDAGPAFLFPFREGGPSGKMGLHQTRTGRRTEARFHEARPSREGMAAVRIGNAWGFVDPELRLAVPAVYEEVQDFREGRAVVKRNGRWGYVDRSGLEILALGGIGIDSVRAFSEGRGALRGPLYHLVDRDGNFVGKEGFQELRPFSEGLAAAQREGRWGYIDPAGTWVIEPRFERVRDFHAGLAAASSKGRWGFLDRTGAWAIEPRFAQEEYVGDFGEDGLARARFDHRWGFIDRRGERAIQPWYREVRDFSEGRAAVLERKQWFYIDTEGKRVGDLEFYAAAPFEGGVALVGIRKGTRLVGRDGVPVTDALFWPFPEEPSREGWHFVGGMVGGGIKVGKGWLHPARGVLHTLSGKAIDLRSLGR